MRQVKFILVFLRAGERTEQLLWPPSAVGANFAWMHPCGKEFSLEAQHRASTVQCPEASQSSLFIFRDGTAIYAAELSLILRGLCIEHNF